MVSVVPTPRVITFAGFVILMQEKPFYRIFENFSLLYLVLVLVFKATKKLKWKYSGGYTASQ